MPNVKVYVPASVYRLLGEDDDLVRKIARTALTDAVVDAASGHVVPEHDKAPPSTEEASPSEPRQGLDSILTSRFGPRRT